MSGLYFHFPFCKSRCIYCAFYSTTQHALQQHYCNAMVAELDARLTSCYSPPYTIYFGGGTPSSLSTEALDIVVDAVLRHLPQEEITEWTIECNPDDITEDFAAWIASSPINRVSIGIQTFNDTRLRWARRRHTAEQAVTAVKRLRAHGISNISIDLMFGFPSQTLTEWQHDLQQAINLKPEHISAYSLTVEEGTPLLSLCEKGTECATEELSLIMYETLTASLINAGYEHYEISNFALNGYRSKHNSAYWQQTPYLGIGAAAHSYSGTQRSWNVSDINRYILSAQNGQPDHEHEEIGPQERYNDIIATMLRTADGISLDILTTEQREYLMSQAQRHINNGNLEIDDHRIRLTRQALFVSDSIMTDLIMIE